MRSSKTTPSNTALRLATTVVRKKREQPNQFDMIKNLLIFIISITCIHAQEKYKMLSSYEEFKNQAEFEMMNFQGIEKLNFKFENVNNLIGKDYKFIIEEYLNGQLAKRKILIDTKNEGLPKIDSTFHLSLITQNILKTERIGFYLPTMLNKQTYDIVGNFIDDDFSLRNINVTKEYLEFELNKPFQIALITPPNKDPGRGNMGWCQVSQGGINVKSWYEKYEIPQFFLIYMQVE